MPPTEVVSIRDIEDLIPSSVTLSGPRRRLRKNSQRRLADKASCTLPLIVADDDCEVCHRFFSLCVEFTT